MVSLINNRKYLLGYVHIHFTFKSIQIRNKLIRKCIRECEMMEMDKQLIDILRKNDRHTKKLLLF